jgi:glycerol-3-phosphate acyltransferase PlsY
VWIVVGVAVGFGMGSLPFSVWLVRWVKRWDVRLVGDGNPGAINAWRAGGWPVGLAALILDVAKGGVPVALARFVFGLQGWALVPAAVAPIAGHAFSPWLGLRGGKGIAATFGVWSALTFWVVPTTLGLLMAAVMSVQRVAAWTVMVASFGTFVVLLAIRAEPFLIVGFVINVGLLAWTHRGELQRPPRARITRRCG